MSDNDAGSWGTPTAQDSRHASFSRAQQDCDPNALTNQVYLASWQTPRGEIQWAAWPTAKGTDGEKGARSHRGAMKELNRKGPGSDLPAIAAAAAWPTPNAMEGGQTSRSGKRKGELLMGGLVRNGSPASMEKPGQLSPAHSRWLMGYSAEHLSCAPTATRSCLKSRPSSSRASTKLRELNGRS